MDHCITQTQGRLNAIGHDLRQRRRMWSGVTIVLVIIYTPLLYVTPYITGFDPIPDDAKFRGEMAPFFIRTPSLPLHFAILWVMSIILVVIAILTCAMHTTIRGLDLVTMELGPLGKTVCLAISLVCGLGPSYFTDSDWMSVVILFILVLAFFCFQLGIDSVSDLGFFYCSLSITAGVIIQVSVAYHQTGFGWVLVGTLVGIGHLYHFILTAAPANVPTDSPATEMAHPHPHPHADPLATPSTADPPVTASTADPTSESSSSPISNVLPSSHASTESFYTPVSIPPADTQHSAPTSV